MTDFTELPRNWEWKSLEDPDLLCGVVDLFSRETDRAKGSLLVLVADDGLRLLQPIVIEDLPIDCDSMVQHSTVNRVVELARHVSPQGGLAMAVGRGGQVAQTHWDRTWRRALSLACQEQSMTDLGCYLATPVGVVRLDDSAAAA